MFWTGQWYVPWKIVIEVVSKAFDALKEPFFITVVDGATKTVATTEDALAMTVTMARPACPDARLQTSPPPRPACCSCR